MSLYHVTSGEGLLTLGEEGIKVSPGDTALIPPDCDCGRIGHIQRAGKKAGVPAVWLRCAYAAIIRRSPRIRQPTAGSFM